MGIHLESIERQIERGGTKRKQRQRVIRRKQWRGARRLRYRRNQRFLSLTRKEDQLYKRRRTRQAVLE